MSNWPTEKPNKPGYYWLRNYRRKIKTDGSKWSETNPAIILVQVYDQDWFAAFGIEGEMRMSSYEGEWQSVAPPIGEDG